MRIGVGNEVFGEVKCFFLLFGKCYRLDRGGLKQKLEADLTKRNMPST